MGGGWRHEKNCGITPLGGWIFAVELLDYSRIACGFFNIAVTTRKRHSHKFALRKPEGRSPLELTILK